MSEKTRDRLFQFLAMMAAALLAILAEKKIEPPAIKPQPEAPRPTPPDAKPLVHPIEAIGRIQFGNFGCTATVISPRRQDGQYDVLTAAHCLRGTPREGTMKMRNGTACRVRIVTLDATADWAWLVTLDAQELPTARLATGSAPAGAKVWHAGFGIDRPGNTETGEARHGPNAKGQCEYWLSVSSGDSGGAIVRTDTGEVLSPVCCTTELAGPGRVFGACPEACQASRPK